MTAVLSFAPGGVIGDMLRSDTFRGICIAFLSLIALFALFGLTRAIRVGRAKKLVYRREFNQTGAFENETVELVETIYNPTFLPFFSVDVEYWIDGGLALDSRPAKQLKGPYYCVSRFSLMPHETIKRVHTVKCVRRGRYLLESAAVYTGGSEIFYKTDALLYVYPDPDRAVENTKPASLVFGDFASSVRLIRDRFAFSGIRPFARGDSISDVNYKATAKSGNGGGYYPQVNECESTVNRNYLVLNNFHIKRGVNLDYETAAEVFDVSLRYAAALVCSASVAGGRVGFAANCSFGEDKFLVYEPDGGEYHMNDILRGMAAIEVSDGGSFSSLLDRLCESVSYTDIFIISTELESSVSLKLNSLERFGNTVHLITLGN
ncbi:MAG: DUF58 domain-containing protein [Clostridia bacterium]|nr:DUF58 domain-containing protein [Clostridia bacterium]